jgi:hypothetical protein
VIFQTSPRNESFSEDYLLSRANIAESSRYSNCGGTAFSL